MDTDRYSQKEGDVKTQGEDSYRYLQVKECLRLPEARRGLEQILPP